MIETIFLILVVISITWWFIYDLFYSPKAQIRRLWKGVFHIAKEIGEMKTKHPNAVIHIENLYEVAIKKRHKMINALLDYYFDAEEDEEYITENRP